MRRTVMMSRSQTTRPSAAIIRYSKLWSCPCRVASWHLAEHHPTSSGCVCLGQNPGSSHSLTGYPRMFSASLLTNEN